MLEICVDTHAGLDSAHRGGAGRVELCAALDVGGLTPCAGLLDVALGGPLPVHMLVRPRAGDFRYDAQDMDICLRDVRRAVRLGVDGLVLGAGGPDGLDAAVLRALVDAAKAAQSVDSKPVSLTLHRVFDLLADRGLGLEQAIELGFDRILTSGGAVRAGDARDEFSRLVEAAQGRIEIMAGGGLDLESIPALKSVGVREFHASCRVATKKEGAERLVELGFAPAVSRETDQARVRAFATAAE